jgi:hypothetical protein
MDTLSRRSTLLVGLHDAGAAFVEDCRKSADNSDLNSNYGLYELTPGAAAKAAGHAIITDLVAVESTPAKEALLDEPLFKWNGSIKNPVISKTSAEAINTSECFPPALTLLALDYIDKGYGEGDTIYDRFVKKIGGLFMAGATPHDFRRSAAADNVGFYFRDPEQQTVSAEDYIVSSPLFFKQLAEGKLPGMDIHDIAHHASQMGLYGDFYKWLASNATEEVLTDPAFKRQQMLVHTVLNTSLEHSLVAAPDGVQSFGCLNWQSPRKSVLKAGVSNRQDYKLNDYPFGARDFNQWSAVRAIASIYRGQIEAERVTGVSLDWMAELGYGMNPDLLKIVQPFESYDYSPYPFDAIKDAAMKVPATPEELFKNCRELVSAEMAAVGKEVR